MTRHAQRFPDALWAALLVALAGCLVPSVDVTFPCNTDADCAEDSACVDNICRGGKRPDGGSPVSDAGRADGGTDAGRTDGGEPSNDAGPAVDSGPGNDAGPTTDAGSDAGQSNDAGAEDAGSDAGEFDAGDEDGSDHDAGTDDAGSDAGVDAGPTGPVPVHHWPFNAPVGAMTVTDVVGSANGTILGGAAHTGTGALDFPGNGGYVDLPNGIISALHNATFEVWVRWRGPENANWARIFDFGRCTAGEVNAPGGGFFTGDGQPYLFLAVRNHEEATRFAITLGGAAQNAERILDAPLIPADGSLSHIVVVYDSDANLAYLYINGEAQDVIATAIDLEEIDDVNNWLGRSNWSVDPPLNALLEDFRIYDVALSAADVSALYAAGAPP